MPAKHPGSSGIEARGGSSGDGSDGPARRSPVERREASGREGRHGDALAHREGASQRPCCSKHPAGTRGLEHDHASQPARGARAEQVLWVTAETVEVLEGKVDATPCCVLVHILEMLDD